MIEKRISVLLLLKKYIRWRRFNQIDLQLSSLFDPFSVLEIRIQMGIILVIYTVLTFHRKFKKIKIPARNDSDDAGQVSFLGLVSED